jgi:3-oxoacyl-[acyl-carrier protein] reductase
MGNGSHKGLTALVTGASGGIGSSIARKFASSGIHIVVHYWKSQESVMKVIDQCKEFDVKVLPVQADIRSRQEVEKMRQICEAEGLLPDIVVNNAGIAHYALLSDLTEEDWDRIMDTNVKGMFLNTQIFMPHMIIRKFGRIINISSVWGLTGASCEVAYSTAKGAMNAFTKALAKELAPSGITVNAIAPGVVETNMNRHLTSEEQAALKNEIPAGRFANPEEIAELAYFLSLPQSAYITGQIISPNGGWLT